jgi:glycosyltransferase involved in cell wall biosynthesis
MADVVLPVLNEAEALPWVLRRIPDGYNAIVVDNGSTDDSARIASRMGARVVEEPRKGFGAACYAGLQASSDEIVCFMDCDGSLDPAALPVVLAPIGDGIADLALGRRRPRGRAWATHARLANRVLAFEVRRRTGVRLTDLGPMRAARRAPLLALGLEDRRSGWPLEMVLKAAAAGWKIVEVPVDYAPRAGRSKVTGTVGGTLRAVRDMTRVLR